MKSAQHRAPTTYASLCHLNHLNAHISPLKPRNHEDKSKQII